MKIGTITFHWANNYGAVLQAYALQQFLKNNGYDTEIIDYKPARLYFRELIRDAIYNRKNLTKRRKIKKFIKKHIRLSDKTAYQSSKVSKINDYNAVVCGSDQIWNEWLLFHAEKNPCTVYYLGTVGTEVKKISYAASFGTNILKEETKTLIQPILESFSGISVRENTAVEMLKDINISAIRVCDPTLLLDGEDYLPIFADTVVRRRSVFPFILHKNQDAANEIVQYVKRHFNDTTDTKIPLSVNEWLSSIANCDIVVTNSFHATVFSILFHKNFIVLPVDGKDMNDRITTLLDSVGLSRHFCMNKEDVENCIIDKIDWKSVDECVAKIKNMSSKWLVNCIEL